MMIAARGLSGNRARNSAAHTSNEGARGSTAAADPNCQPQDKTKMASGGATNGRGSRLVELGSGWGASTICARTKSRICIWPPSNRVNRSVEQQEWEEWVRSPSAELSGRQHESGLAHPAVSRRQCVAPQQPDDWQQQRKDAFDLIHYRLDRQTRTIVQIEFTPCRRVEPGRFAVAETRPLDEGELGAGQDGPTWYPIH